MESAEHVWIGDQVTVQFDGGHQPAKETPLQITSWRQQPASSISYGQGIALGGDFYGVVGKPISSQPDPKVGFRDAWATLANSMTFLSGRMELAAILALMHEEMKAVEKAIKEKKEPSSAYEALGDSLSVGWAAVTGFRYLFLALENFDHFGRDAETAYRAGHAVAMEEAARAGRATDKTERRARLERAYAMNAFADHFLTDLFSAGHLRVPRRQLFKQVPLKTTSGNLTRAMHNEDSVRGVDVRNQADDKWRAYGDKRLRDSVSTANRGMVMRAAQLSADEVWDAFNQQPPAKHPKALLLTPDYTHLVNTPLENFPALFVAEGEKVLRRRELFKRDDRSYVSNWDPAATYRDLVRGRQLPYDHVKCYDLETNKFLGWLSVGGNRTVTIIPEVATAHGIKWCFSGDDLYLEKDTSGGDLYLAAYSNGTAGWGPMGSPVVLNEDGTVSVKDNPERKLYLRGLTDGVWFPGWTDGTPNRYLVRIDMPLPDPEA